MERKKEGRRIGYAWEGVNHNMEKLNFYLFESAYITKPMYMAFLHKTFETLKP